VFWSRGWVVCFGGERVVVSSRLGLWDENNFFFTIKASILSPKPYVKEWEKFGSSPLNLGAPYPLLGDSGVWGVTVPEI
jgi:hypothetical protein